MYTFACIWQEPFLNQRKEENECRNYFMLNLRVSMHPGRDGTHDPCSALTPLFGNGARAHGIGKISSVFTKIGKFDIILMYDVSIAWLIPIIKLALVYYEKRKRKKQVWLYSINLWNCKYVTICSVNVLYEILKMENQKKKIIFFFFVKLGNFYLELGNKHTFWHLEWGRISALKLDDQELCPGSAVRYVSAVRHVTDCATRPGKF